MINLATTWRCNSLLANSKMTGLWVISIGYPWSFLLTIHSVCHKALPMKTGSLDVIVFGCSPRMTAFFVPQKLTMMILTTKANRIILFFVYLYMAPIGNNYKGATIMLIKFICEILKVFCERFHKFSYPPHVKFQYTIKINY